MLLSARIADSANMSATAAAAPVSTAGHAAPAVAEAKSRPVPGQALLSIEKTLEVVIPVKELSVKPKGRKILAFVDGSEHSKRVSQQSLLRISANAFRVHKGLERCLDVGQGRRSDSHRYCHSGTLFPTW